jgi:hypothetical protein
VAILFPHANLTIVYKYSKLIEMLIMWAPSFLKPGPELMQNKQVKQASATDRSHVT